MPQQGVSSCRNSEFMPQQPKACDESESECSDQEAVGVSGKAVCVPLSYCPA